MSGKGTSGKGTSGDKHAWTVLPGGKPAGARPRPEPPRTEAAPTPPERRHGQMGYSGPERRKSGQGLPVSLDAAARRASWPPAAQETARMIVRPATVKPLPTPIAERRSARPLW